MRIHRLALAAFASIILAITCAAQQPASAASKAAVRSAILALEKENDRAAKVGDKAALDRLYTADFAGTDAIGGTTNKAQFLSFFGDRKEPLVFNDSDLHDVHVLGSAAFVRARLKYQSSPGGTVSWMRYTRIYALRDGKWLVVSEHYCFDKQSK